MPNDSILRVSNHLYSSYILNIYTSKNQLFYLYHLLFMIFCVYIIV